MNTATIRQEFNTYLPLLSEHQQIPMLDMVKNILNVDETEKRITRKQYNKELKDAETRIAQGKFISHEQVEKELQMRIKG